MEKLRNRLVKTAKKIKWIPDFGLDRELDWLKNMRDWLISKKRYWGLALPIFECKKCSHFEVIGSKQELQEKAVEGWEKFEGKSPHKPWIDFVKIKCKKCGQPVSRIPDVGNPWLDAGIVPFSTTKYFEDRNYWRKWFPVELVCESFPGQFKNWFYSLLVMAAVLEDTNPMKTIFGYAVVRDEKGEEMHKSKGNAIWFDEAAEKVGADPMRWLYARHNPTDNLLFGYKAIEEVKRRMINLYNSFVFFKTYIKKEEIKKEDVSPNNVLDKWIVSKINNLAETAEKNINEYNPGAAAAAIEDFFINDLSLWYIRRSRERFRPSIGSGQAGGEKEAVATLYNILLTLTKLISPIVPFFAEAMYQEIKTDGMPESVHLCDWPKANKKLIDKNLEENMKNIRGIVTLALAQRAEKGIKVRQPLASLKVQSSKFKVQNEELLKLIKDEVNVKEIVFDDKIKKEVELDTEISEELKKEGNYRELLRNIKAMRKELGLTPEVKVSGIYSTVSDIVDKEKIKKDAGAKEFFVVKNEEEINNVDIKKEVEIMKGKKDFIGIDK
jgi:isoleucyl-tRNA synthetase